MAAERARSAVAAGVPAQNSDSDTETETEPATEPDTAPEHVGTASRSSPLIDPHHKIEHDMLRADAAYVHPSAGHRGPHHEPPPAPAPGAPWRLHPLGLVAAGTLLVALLYHTVLDTEYQIGDFEPWEWVALAATVALAAWPAGLNGLRIGLDGVATFTKRISMFLAWFVFFVQFFNVVTRYGTRYVEQDILIGEATSLAWQSFAALFLLGANYGIRDGVNPRIDFWWANFADKTKAWIDFVVHATLFLPFVYMAIRILQPNAALALGRARDGSWPSGFRVWETWEQAPDADQLPVGHVKALLLVGFVLIFLAVVSELIKTGFVIANRPAYGQIEARDTPQRIE